jgi:hypothetical protein
MSSALIFDEFEVEDLLLKTPAAAEAVSKYTACFSLQRVLLGERRKHFDCGAQNTQCLCKVSSQRLESARGFYLLGAGHTVSRIRRNTQNSLHSKTVSGGGFLGPDGALSLRRSNNENFSVQKFT